MRRYRSPQAPLRGEAMVEQIPSKLRDAIDAARLLT
jgi:hypothetical protein